MRCVLAVALTLIAAATADPYLLRGSDTLSLCLGAKPSDTLRSSLRMCRELAYEFCVNSSLVGSLFRKGSETAVHFNETAFAPTVHNVEKLAWLVDASLVLIYDAFTSTRSAHIECIHEWRAWVCSRAFQRTAKNSHNPQPACAKLCERAAESCDAFMQCPVEEEDDAECTDFFRDVGRACSINVPARARSKRSPVPVFKEVPHKTNFRHTAAASSIRQAASLPAIVALSTLIAIFFAAVPR